MTDKIVVFQRGRVLKDSLEALRQRGFILVEVMDLDCIRFEPQMTLRDQFAAAIISSVGLNGDAETRKRIAELAYKQADAMLAARELEAQNQNKE